MPPKPSNPHRIIPVTVVSNEQLAPRLHRVTFTASDFADYPLDGPDEFFGLLMPRQGEQFHPFDLGDSNIRATVANLPEETRPELRWYTIRGLDPATSTMWTDVVTHGDSGPGSRWVRRALPGDTAGMYMCGAIWVPAPSPQLMIADASSIPALRHVLAHLQRTNPEALALTDIIAVITDLDEVEPDFSTEWSPQVRSLTVVTTSKTLESDATLASLRDHYSPEHGGLPRSLWACGEGSLAKTVRKFAVDELQLSPDVIEWSPFWFHGKARP